MEDEWRAAFEVAHGAEQLEEELRARAPEEVVVSSDAGHVYVYGPSREFVEGVVPPALDALAGLTHWHPTDGWVDPDEWIDPEPVVAQDWEMIARLPHLSDAYRLVEKLSSEGRRGWHHGRTVAVQDLTRRDAEHLAFEVLAQISPTSSVEAREYVPPDDGIAPGMTFGWRSNV